MFRLLARLSAIFPFIRLKRKNLLLIFVPGATSSAFFAYDFCDLSLPRF